MRNPEVSLQAKSCVEVVLSHRATSENEKFPALFIVDD
jgi:hypothetical protein